MLMTNLKTLKDFIHTKKGRRRADTDTTGLYNVIQVGEINQSCCPNQIRDEAIKWIKADKSNYYSREGMDETKLWIKHFFNITNEDLK